MKHTFKYENPITIYIKLFFISLLVGFLASAGFYYYLIRLADTIK